MPVFGGSVDEVNRPRSQAGDLPGIEQCHHPMVLRGRDDVHEQVSNLLFAANAGRGGGLVIEGWRGLGRTAQLQRAGAVARSLGFRVVCGRAHSSVVVGGAFPEVGGNTVGELGRQLAERARDVPHLVLVDDLHRAEPPVVAGVRDLIAELRGSPIAWLVTVDRGAYGPRRRVPRRMLERADVRRIVLSELAADATAELVSDVLGFRPDATIAGLVEEAGGNPHLLVELTEDVRADGDRAAGAEGTSYRVDNLIDEWLEDLSPTATQALRIGAVLGHRVEPGLLAVALGTTTALLMPALDELLGTGHWADAGDSLAFRYSLVRRRVLSSIPGSVRRALEDEMDRLAGSPPATRPHRPVFAAIPVQASARPVLDGRTRYAMAVSLLKQARPQRAAEEAATVLAEPGLPEGMYQQATAVRLVALFKHDQIEAMACAQRELARRAPAGGPALATALVVLSCLAWRQVNVTEALSLGRQAVSASTGDVPNVWRVDALMSLAFKLSSLGLFDEAESLLGDAERDIALLDDRALEAVLALVRSRCLTQSGRVPEAVAAARSGLAVAADAGSRLHVALGQATVAAAALYSGDLEETADLLEQHRAERSGHDPSPFAWLALRLAEARDVAGEASALLQEHASSAAFPVLCLEEAGAAAALVRLAMRVGDRVCAGRVVAEAEELSARNPRFAVLMAAAAHSRGELDADPTSLETAACLHTHPWAKAQATERLGTLLVNRDGVGDRKAGISRLQDSIVGYSRVGARRDAARVSARLRALGVRHQHRKRKAAEPPDEISQLTDAETAIAKLVARGMTNRQVAERLFLSAHTVNFHLRRIFRKLDISSRTELARIQALAEWEAEKHESAQPPGSS